MPRGYGALVSAIGVGAAAAAFFMAGRRRPHPAGPAGARLRACCSALALTAAALAPGFWPALMLFTVAGCLMALNGIAANTMLQIQAPDRLRGRVMGFYSFVVLGHGAVRLAPGGLAGRAISGCGPRWRREGWSAWRWRGGGVGDVVDPGEGACGSSR